MNLTAFRTAHFHSSESVPHVSIRFICVMAVALTGVEIAASSQTEDDVAERPLKVFVLAGTSNMLGAHAKVEDLPEDLRGTLADVLVPQNGKWLPLEAGKNLVGNEAVFGQAMAKHLGHPRVSQSRGHFADAVSRDGSERPAA